MLVSEFNYNLPEELIARYPAEQRDSSRLMVVNRFSGKCSESIFCELPRYLKQGDVLVLNDTKVIPARIFGTKTTGGKVEIFLLNKLDSMDSKDIWNCMLRGSKRFHQGQIVNLASGMIATIISKDNEEQWVVAFSGKELFFDWLEREGHIPLPPYLQRQDEVNDKQRYQTVFASNPGAVAAPTAGLHLTTPLLKALEKMGVVIVTLTLHTGLGTFLPVRTLKISDHLIHRERFTIPAKTAQIINEAKAQGRRIVAVGTTSARTLEYAADLNGSIKAGNGEADIFIFPGYRFKVVDALITNFHLPESTLLMLVSAFAGMDLIRKAYELAITNKFRFYSYGDAMLLE